MTGKYKRFANTKDKYHIFPCDRDLILSIFSRLRIPMFKVNVYKSYI